MADTVYNRFKFRSASADTDWGGSDIRMLLLETTAAGAFDPDLNTVTDLLAVGGVAEFAGTNYARATLAGEAVTEDDGNDWAALDATDVVFANLGAIGGGDGSVVAAVIYDEGGGTDGTRYLIAYYDSGFPVITNGQNLTIAAPNDFLRLT